MIKYKWIRNECERLKNDLNQRFIKKCKFSWTLSIFINILYIVISLSQRRLLICWKTIKKTKSSIFIIEAKKRSRLFSNFKIYFHSLFFFYFDLKKKIKIKTNALNFVVIEILNQRNDDDHWRLITFWSRKLISIKQNYKTHDQELLIIITMFKQWKHYLKNNAFSMKIWF